MWLLRAGPSAAAPPACSQVSSTSRLSPEHRGPEPDLRVGSGQQGYPWALCACPFIAGLWMTPLSLLTALFEVRGGRAPQKRPSR